MSTIDKKRKRKRNSNSFETYSHKVLNEMRAGMGITKHAMSTVETLLNDVFERVLVEAGHVVKANKKATLTDRDVQTAVRLTLPGELQKMCANRATAAVTNSNDKTRATKANNTRSKRAGLIFPVGRVERLMRNYRVASRIGASAAIYMAAVLECMVRELMEMSTNIAREFGAKRIKPRHIMLFVTNDEEFERLFTGFFARSGVTPYIQKVLLPPKKKLKK